MGKNRRQYTKEFKIEAVRLIVEEGRPILRWLVSLELPRVYYIVGKRSLRKGKPILFLAKVV